MSKENKILTIYKGSQYPVVGSLFTKEELIKSLEESLKALEDKGANSFIMESESTDEDNCDVIITGYEKRMETDEDRDQRIINSRNTTLQQIKYHENSIARLKDNLK